MAKYNVKQSVMCLVNVTYVIDAESMVDAILQVSILDCPTCVDGRDFEIIEDCNILSTKIEKAIQ